MKGYKSVDISCVINVDEWQVLEESPIGSRAKVIVAHPETDTLYIFKEPKPEREAQIWSELIASFIAGDLLDWSVQHTAIAIRKGKIGNLLKYIYDPEKDTFIFGEQLCKHIDPEFDPKQGKRHTWNLIRRLCIDFLSDHPKHEVRQLANDLYMRFWGRAIAFDTLISNTDRHAENWALLLLATYSGDVGDIMAPLYDNATSMGCEIDEDTLNCKWFDQNGQIIQSKVLSYIARGCHHLRDGEHRFKFDELAKLALTEFPAFRADYEAIAKLNINEIERFIAKIGQLQGIPDHAILSHKRAQQIIALLNEGQKRVISCLEDTL